MSDDKLKRAIERLNEKEPFTKTEKKGISIKEQNLIRGIQLRDKLTKREALEKYVEYVHQGEDDVKSLATSVRKYEKKYYPKQGGQIAQPVQEFKKKKSKAEIKKENKKQVKAYLKDKKNKVKNEKRYNRIKKASKLYPNASRGELEHGVNSVWSQNYRVKHGLNRNYK
jgi:hypothetical protein